MQVLAAVFSHLEQLKDVLACAMASRHLQTIVGYAPLRLHICEEEFSELSASDLAFATNNLRLALKTVCKHFKGVFRGLCLFMPVQLAHGSMAIA